MYLDTLAYVEQRLTIKDTFKISLKGITLLVVVWFVSILVKRFENQSIWFGFLKKPSKNKKKIGF